MELTKRDLAAILLGLLIGSAMTHAVEISAWSARVDWPKTFESIAHIAQAIGLLLGGIWAYYLFVRQRLGRCRINLEHSVQTMKLDGDYLVRILLEIKNTGTVLVAPSVGAVRLHQVAPADPAHLATVKTTAKTAEENWPQLGSTFTLNLEKHLRLEPGERERYAIDFVVPSTVKGVQVHSKVYFDSDDPETYMDLATLHGIPAQEFA